MLRRAWMLSCGLMLLMAVPAVGQGVPGARAQRLRRAIQERFTLRVKQELGLSDQQATQLREVTGRYADKQQDFDRRERDFRMQLQGELRPGVAADQQKVATALDGLTALQLDKARAFQDEMRELAGFLTPVQRAQFFILRDRLMQRVQDVRDQRAAAADRSSPR